MDYDNLVKTANNIKENAYAPYSKFRVGAALIGNSGEIYSGVNIENSSYGATICAERVAISKAISEGERSIEAIAISSDSPDYVFPCGICRQVILEFASESLVILCSNNKGEYKIYNLNDFMPNPFTLK